MTKHLFIPDVQAKEGVSLEHLSWVGEYIVDKQPDVIVQIGDFADMPSLSSYDKGKLSFEGRRYKKDIDATKEAMSLLLSPMKEYNAKMRSQGHKMYRPKMVLTLGNHEDRIDRAIDNQPELDGLMSMDDLPYSDWEVVPYLKPVTIDGVMYTHFNPNPMTGKPRGGRAALQLEKVGTSFVCGHQQLLDVATRFLPCGRQQWGVIAGACLTSDHKVLTADLRYVTLGSVEVGDKIVSFEEFGKGRKRGYKTGTVLNVKKEMSDCFEVSLESGKVFKVTGDHYWLTRVGGQKSVAEGSSYMWRMTSEMRAGTVIPKLLDEWETLDSNDAGYLAGMYDGEGSLYARPVDSVNGSVMQLSLSQKPGRVLDKCISILSSMLGMDSLTHTNNKGVSDLRIKGGARVCAKMLGSVRPIRLLNKFRPELLGSVHTNTNDKVKSIKPIGQQEIVRIEVDEKTMIVEGYPHHNCYTHDESYKGHVGNKHWRGVIMLHDVKDGSFDPCIVSLDYLKRKYKK